MSSPLRVSNVLNLCRAAQIPSALYIWSLMGRGHNISCDNLFAHMLCFPDILAIDGKKSLDRPIYWQSSLFSRTSKNVLGFFPLEFALIWFSNAIWSLRIKGTLIFDAISSIFFFATLKIFKDVVLIPLFTP